MAIDLSKLPEASWSVHDDGWVAAADGSPILLCDAPGDAGIAAIRFAAIARNYADAQQRRPNWVIAWCVDAKRPGETLWRIEDIESDGLGVVNDIISPAYSDLIDAWAEFVRLDEEKTDA